VKFSTSRKTTSHRCGTTTTSTSSLRSLGGWLGTKDHPDLPILINLRLDPFEKMGFVRLDGNIGSFMYMDWFMYEFWRFVFAQQIVGKLAMTAIDYPPMQKGASFNLDAVKEKIAAAMAKHGQ
jgi:hypothetical protein